LELPEPIKEFIRKRTSQRTADQYETYLRTFFAQSEDSSIDRMNAFIPKHLKAHYAFRLFLLASGREDELKLLVKPKGYNRKPVIEGVYLTVEEQKRLIELLPEPYRMIALLQYVTGARANDVLGIKKRAVEEVKDTPGIGLKIKLLTKGGKMRDVWLPENHAFYIADFISASTAVYPFLGTNDLTIDRLDLIYGRYRKELIRAAQTVNPKFRTHDFRRNFVNDTYEKTRDMRKVSSIVGHADPSTTMKYIKKKLDREEQISAVKEMAR
jgi:integrase